MTVTILRGDVRAMLATLPDESCHVVCTSVPYWQLRSYGTEPQIWDGDGRCGDAHEWYADGRRIQQPSVSNSSTLHSGGARSITADNRGHGETGAAFCNRCGAWRGELGLEPQVSLYVQHIVDVFRAVRRVMRKDATCWLNLGDSYAGSGKGPSNSIQQDAAQIGPSAEKKRNPAQFASGQAPTSWAPVPSGLKAKDLCMVPARVAIALQDDGWWLRSDIAWCKTSAMPESVRDRPTSAWEHIFLLARSERYFYDAEAVRTPSSSPEQEEHNQRYAKPYASFDEHAGSKQPGNVNSVGIHSRPGPGGANLRNYLLLGPEPSREEHYAAFPTAIPKIAILAGTSEAGCCAECGAPWHRVVERTPVGSYHQHAADGVEYGLRQGGGGPAATFTPPKHIGWERGCTHDAPSVPCTVLDPFLGSGTTAVVADRLGRNCIGVELQPKYADIAERRVNQDAPLFAGVPVLPKTAPAPDKQARAGNRTYTGFNARWDAKEGAA